VAVALAALYYYRKFCSKKVGGDMQWKRS
jgi:hypothetical protein